MRSHEERPSPFESPSAKLIHWRKIRRYLRNVLLVALAIVFFVEWIGEPMLRWEYRYRGHHTNPQIIDATYVSLSGCLKSHAHQYVEGCPLILFVQPRTPLWRQAFNWLTTSSTTSSTTP